MSRSNEPPKRIFRFLFPDPPPVPVDESARTARPLRIGSRGPIRIALLMAGAIGLVIAAIPAALAAVASGQPLIGSCALAVVTVVTMLLARAFLLGTYVDDDSLIIRRMFSTSVIPWNEISVTLEAHRVRVCDTNGRDIATHIDSKRLDYWLRPHAYHVAAEQLFNWSERR